jgi:acyl-CoA synthetase (AMP-forming)/AMP-acid ligase II
VALAGTLTAGATIVVHHKFDANRLVESALAHNATLVFGVPTMWARLAESGRLHELAQLRLAVSGSAPLAPTLFATIEAAIGCAPVERYGMTETVILTSTPVNGVRRAGTVGRPLPGVRVRIADDGVVEVHGDSVFGGYLTAAPDEPLLRSGFTDDGWFRTGDLAEIGEDKRIRIVGRLKDVVIRNAENISATEVEEAVLFHEAVADVAVVGLPDSRTGERVCAAIVLSPGGAIDVPTLADHCIQLGLAKFKCPEQIVVLEAIERNSMGKIQKDKVRDAVLRAIQMRES